MTRKGSILRKFRQSGSRLPTSAWTGLFLIGMLLPACSGLPGILQPVMGTPLSMESMVATVKAEIPATAEAESTLPAYTSPPIGGYPLPEDEPAGTTGEPKAATPGSITYAIFLPLIFNQLPPNYPFALQSTGVMAIQGIYGCTWIGVGGQIFDLSGAPQKNLILHLEGTWGGKKVVMEALSGSQPDPYGPAGYEFILGNQPLDSNQQLWIQVRDATNKAISERVYLNTFNDCARNLTLINFNQVR